MDPKLEIRDPVPENSILNPEPQPPNPPTPHPQPQTSNPKHQTPNTKHQTPNPKHRTQNTKRQTPNTKHQAPNTKPCTRNRGRQRRAPLVQEIGTLLPNNRRQRRTCYALCHILYPVPAAHMSNFRMDSNSTSYSRSTGAEAGRAAPPGGADGLQRRARRLWRQPTRNPSLTSDI